MIEYNGVIYRSAYAVYKALKPDLSINTFLFRITKLNWTIEDALKPARKGFKKDIVYKGKSYKGLSLLKFFNSLEPKLKISYGAFVARLNNGWTIDEALTEERYTHTRIVLKPYEYKGIKYKSIFDMFNNLKNQGLISLSYPTFKKRFLNGTLD